MMRSLLCVGVPRDALIDLPENGFTTSQGHQGHQAHGHGHPHSSPDFTPSTAAGRMRTAGRRLSLQISSRLAGRGAAEPTGGDEGAGAKFRRNAKRASLGAGGGISKKSIGAPAGFRHEQHIGFPGVVTGGSAEVNWDLEKWREQLEASMKTKASVGQSTYSPTHAARPKGPRPGSISRARGSSVDTPMVAPTPTTPTTQAGSYSQPNLHFASPPRASISSVASLPPAHAGAGSGAGLSRSSSASAAAPGAVNPSRRKPVPSHLPAMTEVAPLPLSVASAPPASAGGGAPFAAQQQRQARGGAQEVQGAIADGGAGADVRPRKEKEKERELVPLLGVPEGRVAGHEAHYVTTTTKARWDGAMSEIANALKDIDVDS